MILWTDAAVDAAAQLLDEKITRDDIRQALDAAWAAQEEEWRRIMNERLAKRHDNSTEPAAASDHAKR
jgi:hypothetical protein